MKNFLEEFKIESKVFERRTLFSLFKLMKRGVVKTVEGVVKEGKESMVISAKDKKRNWLALKIYRTEHCDFKSMWKYLITDQRFSNIKKDRWSVVTTWAKREFKNMKIVFSKNVTIPKPIDLYNNVLVMTFIGGEGIAAPTLTKVTDVDWSVLYKQVVREMKKLAKTKIIHTDLSAYNILYFNEKIYLIDFSQGVTTRHPLAREFLERDVRNINNFFKKKNVTVDENLFNKLKEMYGL